MKYPIIDDRGLLDIINKISNILSDDISEITIRYDYNKCNDKTTSTVTSTISSTNMAMSISSSTSISSLGGTSISSNSQSLNESWIDD